MMSHAAPAYPMLSQAFSHTVICHLPQSYSVLIPPLTVPLLFYIIPALSMLSLICLDAPLCYHLPYLSSPILSAHCFYAIPYSTKPGPRQIPVLSLHSPYYSDTPSQNYTQTVP